MGKKLQNSVLTKNFRKEIMMSPFRKRSINILKLWNDYFESVTQLNSMIYLILWKLCFVQYCDTAISVTQILTPIMIYITQQSGQPVWLIKSIKWSKKCSFLTWHIWQNSHILLSSYFRQLTVFFILCPCPSDPTALSPSSSSSSHINFSKNVSNLVHKKRKLAAVQW